MNETAANRAIKAALNGKWNEAVEFNLAILEDTPQDIQALNRLGRAYAAIGQTNNAAKTWRRVLKLDPYNPIANQQLENLPSKTSAPREITTVQTTRGKLFLDEPGKTKTTQLVRLGDRRILLELQPAQPLKLNVKKRLITVETETSTYVGALPDDLSASLGKFIRGGNKYETLVRRVSKNTLHVFIKEVKRAKRFENTPSFPMHRASPLLHFDTAPVVEHPLNITPTGEDEDYQ